MKWTKQQQNAIDDRNGSLLISAAAGSGKTAVLVERAVGLMLDKTAPIKADRMLIVTFTRAAAQQLRGRISVRLAELQQSQPLNMNLRKQRLLLGRANICTFDAFCMQLLKQYFAELSLPLDFDKGDDALIAQLKAQAITQTLEKMYEDKDFTAFSALYGKSRDDVSATKALLEVYDHLRAAAFPKKQAEIIQQMWTDNASIHETIWGKQLLQEGLIMAQSTFAVAQKALQIAQENGLENYVPALQTDISFLLLVIGYIENNRWDDAYICINEYKAEALKGQKGAGSTEIDLVKSLRNRVKKNIEKLNKNVFVCTQQEYGEDIAIAYPMVKALIRAAWLFEECFFQKKLEAKALEYSDLAHLARKLLCDDNGEKTQVAQEVSSQFDVVMVDEYQDTNNIQSLLYTCLANDSGSNLFMVGDVKQSIYSFRQAQPSIFIEKKDSYSPYDTGKHPAVINLGHNFRSGKNVIDQINFCFEQLMTKQLGGVDYTQGESLVASADADGDAVLDIKIIDTKEGKKDAADATAVALEIDNLIKKGFLVKDSKAKRPCRYGDICILLRAKASFVAYAVALEAMGIPVVGADEGSELISPEISPFVSLLRAIDNPSQDVYLAALMLSPMYNFSPDSLAELRMISTTKSIYSLLLSSNNEKEKQLCDDLLYFRTINACADFAQLCDEIMLRTGYFAAVSAMDEGRIRLENLHSFIGFAVKGCVSAGGLSGFLRRLDTNSKDSSSQMNFKPAAGAVSIMTIHKSKGLEFPICILANTQHGFNVKDTQENFIIHSRLGIGLCLRTGNSLYSTLAHRAVALAQRSELVSEEMRLMYVALTRAKDKLIVTMSQKNPVNFLTDIATAISCGKTTENEMLTRANCMAIWLCAMALRHPMCEELRGVSSFATAQLIPTSSLINAQIITAPSNKQENEETICQPQPIPQLVKQLKQGFETARKVKEQKKIPVKMSVSQLSKDRENKVLARPSFMYSKGLTAAESGTAIHEVLQFVNFENALDNLDNELNRLQSEKFINEEILKKLNKTSFENFLKSDVVQRILSADTVLREYDFLTSTLVDGDKILVQGIADIVIIKDNDVEIVDYKTDKGKTQQQFIQSYENQLKLYAQAVEKRLQKKVMRLTIYSFELQKEIKV